MTQIRLLPPFTSLYRLFLRTASASVLHHTVATRNLRTLWKPTFSGAAQTIRRLQHSPTDVIEREKLENWLKTWERRMDRTLALLYTSARSRGLPHELTRNLSFLVLGNREWSERHYFQPTQYWKPQLPPTSKEYQPTPVLPDTQKARNREAKLQRWQAFDDKAWGALGQVIRMAEGRHGISLGRVTPVKGRQGRKAKR